MVSNQQFGGPMLSNVLTMGTFESLNIRDRCREHRRVYAAQESYEKKPRTSPKYCRSNNKFGSAFAPLIETKLGHSPARNAFDYIQETIIVRQKIQLQRTE
jgi:hypothetical protein